jgi:phenylalanyl-tRNA synthetase alpha chain
MVNDVKNINKIVDSLSPNERKILPHIKEKDIVEICKKSNLDKVSVLRALEYIQNKGIIKIDSVKKKIIELGVNGALYIKKGLPERRLLNLLNEKRIISLKDAQSESKLSDDEFKASLGALKRRALIELNKGKIIFNGRPEEIAKKTLEEQFLEMLPLDFDSLTPEQNFALKSLQSRKNILIISEDKNISFEITDLGKKILNLKSGEGDLIEQITPELLKSYKNWKGKKFRRYDITSPLPEITGGKRHFVNQSIDYIRKIWTDMGFKEISGNMVQQSFWNFDALFQPQDHPARELADTFFINKKIDLPENKNLVESVKKSHESGVEGSKGWGYKWDPEIAKQLVLRTHTTALSAIELSKLGEKDLPVKIFALGKNFRNETVDWSHGFEFYQTEGIVIDKNVNFRHLLGYLKQFYKKMGYDKIRFRPAYFPYTEPSVEIDVWHPVRKKWLELGGAGMFRPEVSVSLLGKNIPILAWGQGVDRIIMDYYKINDLRELYKNNLTQLRKIKFWMK